MSAEVQVAPPPIARSWRARILRLLAMAGVAVGIAWLCGVALRADARLANPPGLFRGMLHGAMMPMAWPALLAGHDQDVYAAKNSGRTYKLGYSLGVNLSGLIFFGWLFVSLQALRSSAQRKKPE